MPAGLGVLRGGSDALAKPRAPDELVKQDHHGDGRDDDNDVNPRNGDVADREARFVQNARNAVVDPRLGDVRRKRVTQAEPIRDAIAQTHEFGQHERRTDGRDQGDQARGVAFQ